MTYEHITTRTESEQGAAVSDGVEERNASEPPARTKTAAAKIFAVDRETWNRACELGLNAAVAYLVLARGTGGDNRTTSWSARSVETHAGMSRDKAPIAIRALIDAGLVTVTKVVNKKPRYRIEPSYRVAGCESFQEDANEAFAKSFKPKWIWLSNHFVEALKGLDDTPVKLLCRRRDLAGLRLLVNLYADQKFSQEGGLDWSDTGIRQTYTRERLGKFGDRVVYAFKAGKLVWNQDGPLEHYGPDFEPAFKRLLDAGLVCMAPHLVDGIGDAAEVVHTLADVWQAAHQDETGPRHKADRLARRLAPASKIADAEARGYSLFVPALDFWNPPDVIGIARLGCQADARLSSEWETRNIDRWHDHASDYRQAFNALESAT